MDPVAGKNAASREEEFLYLLTEGSDLMRAGKISDAQYHFEKALALSPKDEQAKNLLGLSLFRGGEMERAETLFSELVHDNPIEPSLRLNLALVYLKTDKLDQAERTLEQVLDLAPEHPRASNYMGLALEKQSRWAEAAEWYARAGNKARAAEMQAAAHEATTVIPTSVPPEPATAKEPAATGEPAVDDLPAELPIDDDAPHPNPTADEIFDEEDDEISFADVAAEVAKTPAGDGPITVDAAPIAMTGAVSLVDHAPIEEQPETVQLSINAGAEAAALAAASAANFDKKLEPPSKEATADARRRSMNFTLEPEDPTEDVALEELALEPAPVELPGPAPQPVEEAHIELPAAAPEATIVPASVASPSSPPPPSPTATARPVTLERLAASPDRGGHFQVSIDDILYVRTDHIVCLTGELEVEPINRRYRGRRTDSLFGGNDTPLCAAMGNGSAALSPLVSEVKSILLNNEDLYLVETHLLAFSDGLVWENGRLPAEDGEDLDIVHLRGTGKVHLMADAPLVGFSVDAGRPVTIRADRLLGWNGQVVPYRGPFPGLPDSAQRPAIVRFEGQGLVLGT